MDWFRLTDAQLEKMQPFCLGKASDPGRTGGGARLFTEAVLWIAHTGSLARSAAVFWQLELGVQALSRLGRSRRF